MMFSWLPHRSESVCWMRTDLSAFVRSNRSKGSSVIRRHASLRWFGAQKNRLRGVRDNALGVVRSGHCQLNGSQPDIITIYCGHDFSKYHILYHFTFS